jgi:hypothetical protein
MNVMPSKLTQDKIENLERSETIRKQFAIEILV